MGFSLFQVIAVGVVHRMAVGPAVIRHQQNAVQNKAHNAFNPAVGVEGVMADSWAITQQPIAMVPVITP